MNKRVSEPEQTKTTKRPRGAKSSDTSSLQVFGAWWRHHGSSCSDSLARLLSTPLQSLLTWMVIAIALALPTALYLGLKNVQQLGQGWQDSAQMSAFLVRGAKPLAIEKLQRRLEKNKDITRLDRINPSSALAEFQRFSGLGDVLADLDENPLPTVFVIQPATKIDDPDKLTALQSHIQASPLVDNVQLDMGWLRRLHELLALGERIVLALASLLSLGVLLVIGNTLRLAIENRRDEIVVTKMVGGTNGFVRRPFLYTGFWYGLGGGLLAVLLLAVVGLWLSNPVNNLASLYESDHSLYGLELDTIVSLMLGSGFLGWLGAWLAVSRHLRGIEPR
jgi:cell division transport system permease protein